MSETILKEKEVHLKIRDIPTPTKTRGPEEAARLAVEAMLGETWTKLVTNKLKTLDHIRDRAKRRGPKTLFTSQELESIFFFGWLAGLPSAKDARQSLLDNPEARTILGLDSERGAKRRGARVSRGLPSEPSLSRHRHRLGDEQRVIIYKQLLGQLEK